MILQGRRNTYRRGDLERVLNPRSVAIVGATPKSNSFGGSSMENLTTFDGDVFLVNAKYDRIGERICHPSLSSLPSVPDCVVITVGREAVEPLVEECAALGVGGVVIYAAGYGETGRPDRIAEQQRLADIARRTGLRIIGPNSIGIIHHQRRFSLSFTPEVRYARINKGAIGIVSQSGGVCNALTQSVNRGVAISHSLSAGNSCDVDVADLVSYLVDDDACSAIALAFEGVENPARLIEAGERALCAGKPLIAFKFASGSEGATAAVSHTGSLAASSAGYMAALERMGAVVVPDYHTLVETAAFFAKAGMPKARGVAAVSSSGGFAVLAADQAEARGVPMPQPGPVLQARLDELVPEFGAARNPCDVTAQVRSNPMMLVNCIRAMFEAPEYGAVALPFFYAKKSAGNLITEFGKAARDYGKIALAVWVSDWHSGWGSEELEADENIAVFHSMDACMQAVAAWHRWSERVVGVRTRAPAVRTVSADAASQGRRMIEASPNSNLTERESKQLLQLYGVPVTDEVLVHKVEEAVAWAQGRQSRVVLKIESPDVLHKSDAGLVRLNLQSSQEISEAYEDIMARAGRITPPPRINGVLVQEMAPDGVEVMVGARVDPVFGPLILVGLGGIFVEVLRDVVVELAPVGRDQAMVMIGNIGARKVLDGFRGIAPVDKLRLADIISRMSELIADHAEVIEEIDVNPVICSGSRLVAVDALIVKAKAAPVADRD